MKESVLENNTACRGMTRTPRRYKSYNSYACMCQTHCPEYQSYGSGGVMLTSQSSSLRLLLDHRNESMRCRVLDVRDESYTKLFMSTLEAFYQSCAGYNLRYCPFTGFVKRSGNCFSHLVQDVAILLCFLVTNFVVFITIVAKIIVHMFLVLLTVKQWISRTFFTHPDTVEENFSPSSFAQPYLSYYPLHISYDKKPVPKSKATYHLYE